VNQIIRIGRVTWTDGELSGDAEQIARLHSFLASLEPGERLPVFGNGPWVDPVISDPTGFLALAQPALGVSRWEDEGIDWPPFSSNPSNQDDIVA
jgi:hypothetical protein